MAINDLTVRYLMHRAQTSGSAGGFYSRTVPIAYAGLAIAVTAWSATGYLIVAGKRVVVAIISIQFEGLQTNIEKDLFEAKSRILIIADITSCIFYHIFLPSKFSFKLPEERKTESIREHPQPQALVPYRNGDHILRPILSWRNPEVQAAVRRFFYASFPTRPPLLEERGNREMSDSFVMVSHEERIDAMRGAAKKPIKRSGALDRLFVRHDQPLSIKDEKYRQFILRLKEHCKTAVSGALGAILSMPNRFEDARTQYKEFVYALRDAAKAGVEGAEALSYLRFAGIELYSYLHSLIGIVCKGIPHDLSLNNFAEVFEEKNAMLNKAPANVSISGIDRVFRNLSGWANIFFDPLAASNVPYVRAIFKFKDHEIRELRHGDPIIQTDWEGIPLRTMETLLTWLNFPLKKIDELMTSFNLPRLLNGYIDLFQGCLQSWRKENPRAEITADYIAFIREANKRGQNILHIILESAEEKVAGDESSRVNSRMELQKHDNFFPLALPMDGAFFKNDKKITSFAGAKKEFLEQMRAEESPFRIPEKLKELVFAHAPRLLDEAHEIFFNNKENLEENAYPSFLLFAYAHLAFFILFEFKIDILEAICKDDIDRGNVIKTILELYFLILAGKENDPESLEKILINTLGAPFIVKKQGVIKSRKVFISYAIDVLKKMTEDQKARLRDLWKKWKAEEYQVLEVENQGAYPLGSTAGTEEEYRAFLENCSKSEPATIFPSIPLALYTESLKNRELGKEASQIFCSERATIAERQGTSESKKFETKPTPRKTDFSVTMCMNGGTLNEFKEQFDKAMDGYQMYLGDGAQEEASSDRLVAFLKGKGIVTDEGIIEVLRCFQEEHFINSLLEAKKIFENSILSYYIPQDFQECVFCLDVDADKVATIQFIFLTKVVDSQQIPLAQVTASTVILDHRTGAHKLLWSAAKCT